MTDKSTPLPPSKHRVPCPHPDCGALLVIEHGLPAGTYLCHCHAVQIALEWRAPYPYVPLQPYLSVAKKEEQL